MKYWTKISHNVHAFFTTLCIFSENDVRLVKVLDICIKFVKGVRNCVNFFKV